MKFNLDINTTLQNLLAQEDTDGDKKITIDDNGPKSFKIEDINGNSELIEGTYFLSNLLQELALAKIDGLDFAEIDLDFVTEKPVERISRKIKDFYWKGLTRTIDENGILKILSDEKTNNPISYIYTAAKDNFAFEYFKKIEVKIPNLKVLQLPTDFNDEFSLTLNEKPGILALALKTENEKTSGVPFLVPGGRFNEMYGWDSYFIAMGLLVDGKIELARSIADNFKYQIDHYGKILNANRSYYLSRTQPPFYSTLIVDIVNKQKQDKKWLSEHLKTIIFEYNTVWMKSGERLTENGLNRYKAEGIGIPYEVESGHFDDILEKYAPKYNSSVRDFEKKYLSREIVDSELDDYFIHDRSMRESGHDTTNRLINVCAHLNPIALNSLLYKYETDIAFLIKTEFEDNFEFENNYLDQKFWLTKAHFRKQKIDELCWNPERGLYFDYNFIEKKQHDFETATAFYPLWAKLCNAEQAEKLVKNSLSKFKKKGGIAGCTKSTLEKFDNNSPQRQWDYPFGWAPHQILLWEGLLNYGFVAEAQEMVYRWLWLITKNAVDYNGTIPEKFDLEISSHKVFAEYGNVGTQFNYITEEGFGWMNASYQFGLTILNSDLKEKLNLLTDPDILFN